MLLSDVTIAEKLDDGELEITPQPDDVQFQPASLDMRIGREVKNISRETTKHYSEESDEPIVIEPGDFYLCHTVENISLPNNIAAVLTGRSSVARKGLIVHTTAAFMDPGFSGQITLEVYNLNNEPILLKPEMRVGQLLFFPLDRMASTGYGNKQHSKYHEQSGATESRAEEDPEYKND